MSTYNLCFEQKYEKYQSLLSENFQFLEVKFSIYLNRRVFVMFYFLQKTVKAHFLETIRKIFQDVFCWNTMDTAFWSIWAIIISVTKRIEKHFEILLLVLFHILIFSTNSIITKWPLIQLVTNVVINSTSCKNVQYFKCGQDSLPQKWSGWSLLDPLVRKIFTWSTG